MKIALNCQGFSFSRKMNRSFLQYKLKPKLVIYCSLISFSVEGCGVGPVRSRSRLCGRVSHRRIYRPDGSPLLPESSEILTFIPSKSDLGLSRPGGYFCVCFSVPIRLKVFSSMTSRPLPYSEWPGRFLFSAALLFFLKSFSLFIVSMIRASGPLRSSWNNPGHKY